MKPEIHPAERKVLGKVYLRNLRPLSQKEFESATLICQKIGAIVEGRSNYIARHGLDSQIALPDRNWKMTDDNDLYKTYRTVVNPTYDIINKLRFYSNFTGFQLLTFSFPKDDFHFKKVPENYDDFLDKVLTKPHSFVRDFIEITRHLPEWMVAKPPKVFGEIGWDVQGSPINYDIWVHQERLNLLYETGVINWLRHKAQNGEPVNILEIGAGYGALIYFLKEIVPQARFYIIDIPETLLFSSIYLSIARQKDQHQIYDGETPIPMAKEDVDFKFIPNFLFDDLVKSNVKIDLAINTWSFAEIAEVQVDHYASGLETLLGDQGVLFEQNYESPASEKGCNCKEIISKYFVREDITASSLITINSIELGVPTLWTKKGLRKTIGETFKPFNSPEWRRHLKLKPLRMLFNLAHWKKRIFWFLRDTLKFILTPSGYIRFLNAYNWLYRKWWLKSDRGKWIQKQCGPK
ncbi:hypothetical protein UR09_00015 [Candidatus Nitromaritima sp. SCGC AAA799-A02]|nr:hypothetical protein UZ36_00015 [Candidatus Nitromaritima sp. SCGC AAA799-C22]KMP12715.1 hypothetical protein UR09_00015 [Candidatus Nitromaritima sp. SCGC AAA799-A02]